MVDRDSFKHKDWMLDKVYGLSDSGLSCECGELFIEKEPCYRERVTGKTGSKGPFNWPPGRPYIRFICHKCAIKLGLIW